MKLKQKFKNTVTPDYISKFENTVKLKPDWL
jgi:hypothetical protein